MRTLLVTTTHRHCRPGEPSGYVYTVNLEGRRVTGRCPVIEPPLLHADPNPRGGMRGAKGIAFLGDHVFLANASVVHRFDPAWNLVGAITHPSCAYIHDIHIHDGSLWVASCCNDLLFRFDLSGKLLRHINVRTYPRLLRDLGWDATNRLTADAVRSGAIDFRDPRTHRSEEFDGGHLSGVCFLPDGDLLVLLGLIWNRSQTTLFRAKNWLQRSGLWAPLVRVLKPTLGLLPLKREPRGDIGASLTWASSAVLRFPRDGEPRVACLLPGKRVPTHSLLARPDGSAMLCDTSRGEVVHWDTDTGVERARIKVTDEFLRGICLLSSREMVVGSQRDLLIVDVDRRTATDRIRLSDQPNESVYYIKLMPPGFAPLPDRLDAGKPLTALAAC